MPLGQSNDREGNQHPGGGLKTKLLEANRLHDDGTLPLREVHPEPSFIELGLRPEDLGQAVARVPADDVLAAAAAARSAHRIARGEAKSIPDPPQTNYREQSIAISY
jgi:hypothetical protein